MYHTHNIVLESTKQRGMYVHTSQVAVDAIPNPLDSRLPCNLRTCKTFESNISPHGSTYSLHKYGRFEKSDGSSLKTGVPFRLYHSQSESFVQASCDAEKQRRATMGTGMLREDGTQIHVPYLKVGSFPTHARLPLIKERKRSSTE